MSAIVKLDGKHYEEGSSAHLEKISAIHRAEIQKQTDAYVQDLTEQKDLQDRTQTLNDELSDGAREQEAALADANEATQQSEDRFRLLVNGVKDYALFMLDPSGKVT
ncbi:MAG TPA: hypothetical protein VNW92_00420, partial [Polyangiaceae bacterium]|nr:hypothetical protein [Polyangiaceae bacterium]